MIDKIKLDKAIDIRNKYMEDMEETGIDLGQALTSPICFISTSDELRKTADYLGVTLIGTNYYEQDEDYEYQEFFVYSGVKFYYMKERSKK